MKIKDMINEMANLNISQEMIDHQFDSTFGKELEAEFQKFRSKIQVTKKDLRESNISKLIYDNVGITTELSVTPEFNAWVCVPDLDRNNVILQEWRREWFRNKDAEDLLITRPEINGIVNFKTAKVSGDYSKLNIGITVGDVFLNKYSPISVPEAVAILMHELGHVFVYFEMLARLTKTNYVMTESIKQLITSTTKEQRILILKETEKALDVKIDKKEKVAQGQHSTELYATIILTAEIKQAKNQLGVNIYNSRAFEQLADNFATRQGYGRAVATGLDKLNRTDFNKATISPVTNLVLNICTCIKKVFWIGGLLSVGGPGGIICGSLLFLLNLLVLTTNPLDTTYDTPKVRALKIKHQITDALKSPNIPENLKIKYLEDYKVVDEIVNNYNYNKGIWETFYPIFLSNGKRDKTEIQINEELETLLNNDLFSAHLTLNNNVS